MEKDKSLKDKAIDIKGKEYVLVSDRVLYFNETYPEGSIFTELVSKPEDDTVIIKATIKPVEGQNRLFTAYSQATWGEGYINKTSALENAETSAVGRALAFMGIGVIGSIASVDEINKAQTQPERKSIAVPKISPDQAFKKAKQAIEESEMVDDLKKVDNQIENSNILTDDQKKELSFISNEKMDSLDPLK